jgi:hypothetical protein
MSKKMIYVLVRNESSEGDEIRGVYSSRDRAEGAREELFRADKVSDFDKTNWVIREVVLNRRAVRVSEL